MAKLVSGLSRDSMQSDTFYGENIANSITRMDGMEIV